MSQSNNNPGSLFEYFDSETKRKAARKRRLILLVVGFLISSVGYVLFLSTNDRSPQQDLPLVPFEDLDSKKVEVLLTEGAEGFLLSDPETGLSDTIRSLKDYGVFLEFYSQHKGPSVDLDTVIVTHSPNNKVRMEAFQIDTPHVLTKRTDTVGNSKVNSSLVSLQIEIDGEPKEGSPLIFTIPNYNPNWWYVLEYGNGTRMRIKRIHTFTYEESGEYTLKITAIHKKSAQHIDSVCQIEILSAV
ncbi:MAG: hypothetical protein AAF694_20620 [Bacteroidota bacterium]